MTQQQDIAAIVIGRNEGQRLIDCLDALTGNVARIVYIDSGSTDDSVAAAIARGAVVVDLDTTVAFTAARARNAGLEYLRATDTPPVFVQFLDGDCVIHEGWIETALSFLTDHPKVAIACGRRSEKHPDASIYNRLIDKEWDTAIGQAKSCGGDALVRWQALDDVNGFDPSLIAGEEPEMCVRIRAKGWEIWRLDAEMTLHDAALTRFGQWWQRTRRGGFAYAEGYAMHGAAPEYHKAAELRRALTWGAVLPAIIVVGALLSPWALLLLLVWPMQVLRLKLKGMSWLTAVFLTLAKLPEASGAMTYYHRRLRRRKPQLIEYK